MAKVIKPDIEPLDPNVYNDEAFAKAAKEAGMSEEEIAKALERDPGAEGFPLRPASNKSGEQTTVQPTQSDWLATFIETMGGSKRATPLGGKGLKDPDENLTANLTIDPYVTAFGTPEQRSKNWLTPESLRRLKASPATGNYSSEGNDTEDNRNASEMSPAELLKKYFDQAFTTEEYKGLSEQETKDITDRLREQANRTEEDVMGKYASMTGGIPSTAAVQQAAKSGADVISQLQDVLDSREQEKYNRYRAEQSDAYSKLSQLMSLYGYDSSGNKNSTTGTSGTSGTTTIPDSLSTDVGSSNIFSQIATVSGLDPKVLSGYSSSRIEKIGQSMLGEDNPNEVESGEVFKLQGPENVKNWVEKAYPNEIPFLLSAIIDYLYDNAYINGNEREEWLRETGLNEFYAEEKARNYS